MVVPVHDMTAIPAFPGADAGGLREMCIRDRPSVSTVAMTTRYPTTVVSAETNSLIGSSLPTSAMPMANPSTVHSTESIRITAMVLRGSRDCVCAICENATQTRRSNAVRCVYKTGRSDGGVKTVA